MNKTTKIDHPGYSRGASKLEEDVFKNKQSINCKNLKLFFEILNTQGAWAFVLAERKLSWILGLNSPNLMQRKLIENIDLFQGKEMIGCDPIPIKGQWCDLPKEIIEKITSKSDIVIRFGFNLLTGKIISEPEYGVLSFHPGDIRRYRGLSPAMVFINSENKAGVTLQQLTEELDAGNVLLIKSVDITDANTLDEIEHRMNKLKINMLTEGIKRLQNPNFKPNPPKKIAPYVTVKLRKSPFFAGKVLAKNIIGRIKNL